MSNFMNTGMNNNMYSNMYTNMMPNAFMQPRQALPTMYFPSLMNGLTGDTFSAYNANGFNQLSILPNIVNYTNDLNKVDGMANYGTTSHRLLTDLTNLAQGNVTAIFKGIDDIISDTMNSGNSINEQQTVTGAGLGYSQGDLFGKTKGDAINLKLSLNRITTEQNYLRQLMNLVLSNNEDSITSFLQSMGVPASQAKQQATVMKNAIAQNPQLVTQIEAKLANLEQVAANINASIKMIDTHVDNITKTIYEGTKLS